MKSKPLRLSSLCFVTLGVFLFSNSYTFAAETDTKGSVGVAANNNPDEATDPDEDDDIDNDKVPTNGPYSISYVSDFDFGTQKIPKTNAKYYAVADTVTLKKSKKTKEVANFVQISDASATRDGWKLFVSSDEKLVDSSKNEIKGISYEFSNIIANPIRKDGNESQKKELIAVPEKAVTVEVGTGQQVLIAEAEGLNGQGRWHVQFGADATQGAASVAMNVPKGAVTKAGNYKSSLTWNFANAK